MAVDMINVFSGNEVVIYRYPKDINENLTVIDYRRIIEYRSTSAGGPMMHQEIKVLPTYHYTLWGRIKWLFTKKKKASD